MGFQTAAKSGLHGSIFRYRPSGFKGTGLNDLTWGTAYDGSGTSGVFEVVIDGELAGGGGVDTFKWRKNGGAWTEDVDITGAAQTLSDSLTITFAATTGHTADDQWCDGNLDTEATTESGSTAQITESTYRLCFPKKLTWTDDGGETVIYEEFANGKAGFTDSVGTVTVSGNNSFVLASALDQVGYCLGWTLNSNVKTISTGRMGQAWETFIPDVASFSGSLNNHLIACKTFFSDLKAECEDVNESLFLLELYFYDPDQDQTGDMFRCWVNFASLTEAANTGAIVTEAVNFTGYGIPSLIESS